MSIENLDFESLSDERRKAIKESIKEISVAELKALGEKLFPFVEHPWREVYFNFIAEHPSSTYYHATTAENIHVIYCHEVNKGMWFLPGSGRGPLQQRSLEALKAIVEHR